MSIKRNHIITVEWTTVFLLCVDNLVEIELWYAQIELEQAAGRPGPVEVFAKVPIPFANIFYLYKSRNLDFYQKVMNFS